MEDWVSKIQELYYQGMTPEEFYQKEAEAEQLAKAERKLAKRQRERERSRKKPQFIPEKHDDEIYRNIEHYPNYEISNYGNVRKKDTGQYLRGTISNHGYRIVSITDSDHNSRQFSVHRLEAIAFLGDYGDQGMQINHKDGVKTNNRLENLEWCTPSENIQHAHDTGLIKYTEETSRKHREVSRQLYPPVKCIENGKVYPDAKVAAKDLNCNSKGVRGVANGKHLSHNGYHFEIADRSEINVFE